ncbi:hypothetical protein QE250_10635 [Chromatiaceae bacterium AAb-1]|nr:hypothetical protein [Chromatiaceae bacterium AAb-1]
MNPNRFEKVAIEYHRVPFYRRRWFLFLSLLLCAPVTILIALSGDIYAQSKDSVYKFKGTQVFHLVLFAFVVITIGLRSYFG